MRTIVEKPDLHKYVDAKGENKWSATLATLGYVSFVWIQNASTVLSSAVKGLWLWSHFADQSTLLATYQICCRQNIWMDFLPISTFCHLLAGNSAWILLLELWNERMFSRSNLALSLFRMSSIIEIDSGVALITINWSPRVGRVGTGQHD